MPSFSARQARFMAAVAHDPSFAQKAGVPQSVGIDFNQADQQKRRRQQIAGLLAARARDKMGGY
jgi:hypothetical protein